MKNESEKPNLNPLDFTPRPMENLFEELSHFESKSNVSPKVFSEIKRPGQSLTCNPRDSLDLFPEAILFNFLELSVGTNSKRNYLEPLIGCTQTLKKASNLNRFTQKLCSQSATNNAMRYMKVGHKQGFPSKQFCQSSLNVWSAQRLSSKQGSQSPQGVFTNTMASRYKKIKTAQDTFSKHFNQSSFQTRSPQYTFNNPTMCTVCISTEQPYKHIVTLQRQCKPVWNHEFIDHVIHYGSVAYGVGNFSKEEIVEESNAVDRGEPSLRYSNHNPKCWEIFVDGELAGDICVTQPPEKEITISVFDRFANKGVGENALKQFLAQTDLSPLTAIVKSGNPLLKPIVHMLERNNFQVVSRGAGLNVMLQWDRNRSRTDSF